MEIFKPFYKYIEKEEGDYRINFNYYQLGNDMLFWHKEQGVSIIVKYLDNSYSIKKWPKNIEKVFQVNTTDIILVSNQYYYLYNLENEIIKYFIPILESGDFEIQGINENGIYLKKQNNIFVYKECCFNAK